MYLNDHRSWHNMQIDFLAFGQVYLFWAASTLAMITVKILSFAVQLKELDAFPEGFLNLQKQVNFEYRYMFM